MFNFKVTKVSSKEFDWKSIGERCDAMVKKRKERLAALQVAIKRHLEDPEQIEWNKVQLHKRQRLENPEDDMAVIPQAPTDLRPPKRQYLEDSEPQISKRQRPDPGPHTPTNRPIVLLPAATRNNVRGGDTQFEVFSQKGSAN